MVGTYGVLDEELHRPQPFALDLGVWADLDRAAASDALDDTVDYGELTTVAAAVVAGTSCRLLEALATSWPGRFSSMTDARRGPGHRAQAPPAGARRRGGRGGAPHPVAVAPPAGPQG